MQRLLPQGGKVLDFGSGPSAALSDWLKDLNYDVEMYDKYFVPDEGWKNKKYDAIIASEVLEHLREPGEDILKISQSLKDGGFLIVSTGLTDEISDLENWYYVKDPTHLVFFSKSTLRWVGDKFGYQYISSELKRVVTLKKIKI